jgi:glycosyltransferase involved in cell wall biosynthesis
VIADNGCTDGTLDVVDRWADRLPAVRVVDARDRRGINRARNAGTAAARGDFLAFCDADDVAAPGWLAAMASAADGADIVGGRLEWETLNAPIVLAWRYQEPMTELMDDGFLSYAPGGNLGVWTAIAREIGWDEQFTYGSSDHGFAWNAQLAGYRLAYVPEALMQQRFRGTIRDMAVQQYRYGRSTPRLYRAFRDTGMPPPDNREALWAWSRLIVRIPDLWRSREARGDWIRSASYRTGRAAGSIRSRVLFL